MKKILVAFLACMFVILSGCNNVKDNDINGDVSGSDEVAVNDDSVENTEADVPEIPVVINAASLKGPTSIGFIKVIDEAANVSESEYVFDFKIEAAADAISPLLIKGELDVAAVPANLASVLYNKTNGGIVVLDINTLGVLYIVENGNTVSAVEDLRGKTIYASGKGNTPEYALNYMLESNGLVPGKDVFVEFKTEHAECVSAIMTDSGAVAMLPQPFATTAVMSNNSIRIALDINKAWNDASGKTLVTGVTVARREFVKNHPEAVKMLIEKHRESAEFVVSDIKSAAQLVEKHGIFKSAVAEQAIPFCSISAVTGIEMKDILSNYLSVLASQNMQAVGGGIPGDDFYYIAE